MPTFSLEGTAKFINENTACGILNEHCVPLGFGWELASFWNIFNYYTALQVEIGENLGKQSSLHTQAYIPCILSFAYLFALALGKSQVNRKERVLSDNKSK